MFDVLLLLTNWFWQLADLL